MLTYPFSIKETFNFIAKSVAKINIIIFCIYVLGINKKVSSDFY